MSLTDLAAQAATPKIPWRTCAVCHVAQQLPDTDRALLETVLAAENVTHSDIARHLTDEGHGRVGEDSVGRHRHGRCNLGKAYLT